MGPFTLNELKNLHQDTKINLGHLHTYIGSKLHKHVDSMNHPVVLRIGAPGTTARISAVRELDSQPFGIGVAYAPPFGCAVQAILRAGGELKMHRYTDHQFENGLPGAGDVPRKTWGRGSMQSITRVGTMQLTQLADRNPGHPLIQASAHAACTLSDFARDMAVKEPHIEAAVASVQAKFNARCHGAGGLSIFEQLECGPRLSPLLRPVRGAGPLRRAPVPMVVQLYQ